MPRPALTDRVVWAFVPFVVVSAVHVALLTVDLPFADVTKLLLMPLLVVPVAISDRQTTRPRALLLLLSALLLSWLGDGVATFFPALPELPFMLLFFGIAHLAYIALFARYLRRRRMPWWALIYAAWWVAMLMFLGPHTGGLLIGVAIYGAVLGGTAVFSTRCHPIVATGGAFFLASDTILALRLFLPGGLPAWSDSLVMLTYTIGQGLIVAGTLITLQRRT